jgi:hypothetical protein
VAIYDRDEHFADLEPIARFWYADALLLTGGDRARAVREAERALDGYRQQAKAEQVAEVEAWLAKQRR